MNRTPIHIALDTSNIYVGARAVAGRREGLHGERNVRIELDHLFQLAAAGRDVQHAWAVGSGLPRAHPLWSAARRSGFDVDVLERGRLTNTEQGVDATLQAAVLRTIIDAPDPGILAILSGDGAGRDAGHGFLADAIRARRAGFGIEVLAWADSCSRDLRAFAEEHGAFIDLTNWYDQVTFLEGSRRAAPLSLRRRRAGQLPPCAHGGRPAQAA